MMIEVYPSSSFLGWFSIHQEPARLLLATAFSLCKKKTAKWIMDATSAMGLDIWLIKIFLCKLQPAMENFVV
jgi:hypothetical protein